MSGSSTFSEAILHLNDKPVGTVTMRGCHDSWFFGQFAPSAAFGEFAALFGRWSLLIHADQLDEKLSAAASDELRAVEIEIDVLRAKLLVPSGGNGFASRSSISTGG